MRFSSAAALALTLALAACGTTPRPAGDQPPAARPAIPPPATPVIQGPSGPLAPAHVGEYMDSLETALRRHLRGVVVARQGDTIDVVIPNNALFTPEGEVLARSVLDPLAAILRGYPHTALEVGGYTDSWGNAERNLVLSDRRARAVAGVLSANGVAAPRIAAHGYGETHLRFATGDNRQEPRNRRIEILIKPRPGA